MCSYLARARKTGIMGVYADLNAVALAKFIPPNLGKKKSNKATCM